MVVKSDGTKWACMSCLKGHRVSGCTHVDRELVLVPKKGRPVTQCHHCRQERKKRSAHVKCDCGETEKPHHPREKCIHLREAEERAKAGLRDVACEEKDVAHLVAVAEEQGCCCHHGGKCSCSLLKKEFRDADGLPHGPAVKPRLETTRSEGSITVFQNGHHKPVHRKNHAAHESGMPYKLPFARTSTDQGVQRYTRRSVDSLSSSHSTTFNPANFTQQLVADPGDFSHACSGQPSPDSQTTYGSQGQIEFPFSRSNTVRPIERSQSASSDLFTFPSFDNATPLNDGNFEHFSMSVADMSSMPNNNPFSVWPTSTDVSSMVQPALTAASSGTQSEIDEIPTVDDTYGFSMPSIQEDAVNTSGSPQSNRRSLPPNFFSQTDLVIPVSGDWSAAITSELTADPKTSLAYGEASSTSFVDPWQVPPTLQRGNNTLGLTPGRPASHSIGPGSAPADDLMQQLFPEININDNAFTSGSPMQISPGSRKTFEFTQAVDSDFGNFDGDIEFTSSAWTEGTVPPPNQTLNPTFGMERDSRNQDFSNIWPQ